MATDQEEYRAAEDEYQACVKAYYVARNAMFKAEDRRNAALRKVSAYWVQAVSVDGHGNILNE